MMRRCVFLLLTVWIAAVPAAAACARLDVACWETLVATAPENREARRGLGIALTEAALRGSREAALRARAWWEEGLAAHPDDALARAHHGWLLVLAAREAAPTAARAQAEAGLRELDAAVAAAPHDAAVRLVRARNDYVLPALLGREAGAAEDFRRLVALVHAPAGVDSALSDELRRGILFHAGCFALKRRSAEAIFLLEQARDISATDPTDGEVQSMLALARRELTPPSDVEAPSRP